MLSLTHSSVGLMGRFLISLASDLFLILAQTWLGAPIQFPSVKWKFVRICAAYSLCIFLFKHAEVC